MRHKVIFPKTTIRGVKPTKGLTIEQKMEKLTLNNEPISEGDELIFTEANEGVAPEYDIRTSKWDVVVDAADKLKNRRELLKQQEAEKKQKEEAENKPGNPGQ